MTGLLAHTQEFDRSEGDFVPARKREDPDNWWTRADAEARSELASDPAHESRFGEAGTDRPTVEHPERTDVIPRALSSRSSERDRFFTPGTGGRGGIGRTRPAARRIKRTLHHVDPLSILKLSLFYYGCFVILWLVVVAVAYVLLASLGLFDAIEKFGRAFVLWKRVDITLLFVERWALLIGAVLALVASLVNLVLAFLYNLAADVVGGAEMTFVERDL